MPKSHFTVSDVAKIAALLLTACLLLAANGLHGTLVPVRAELAGFSTLETGFLGTAYFMGFVAGCVATPALIIRCGHVRSFALFGALTAAVLLLHPVFVDALVWSILRASIGFAAAGMFATIESWLNSQASNANRGRVFTTYATLNALALIAGNALFTLGDPREPLLFSLAAILTMLCLIPVCLTRQPEPQRGERARIRLLRLFKLSPAGFAGSIAVGLAGGAFWSLGPLFASESGLAKEEIALFMSTAILGGALATWPMGRMSDFMDRRFVIAMAAIATIAASLFLSTVSAMAIGAQWTIYAGAFAFGIAKFPIGSLANAHMNDRAQPHETMEMASGILFVYGAAAALGPALASIIMNVAGASSLFYFIAGVYSLYAAFVALRVFQRSAPEHEPMPAPTLLPAQPLAEVAPAGKAGLQSPLQYAPLSPRKT
jgi:MFS family permease